MTHVLFSVNNFPPSVGGVEMHVSRLADELVALGHRVTVVAVAPEGGSMVERGIRVIRIRGFLRIGDVLSFPAPGTARRLRRYLSEHDVAVVSTHTRFFPMSVIGVRAARRASLPVVHTEHGSDHVRGVSLPVAIASRMVDHSLGRWVLSRATIVLAVSEAVGDFVRRLAGVEARVFYNAIDIAPWEAARPTESDASERLTFLGRLVPGKGWEDFLDVVAAAVAAGRSPLANIIGDGPDRERVEAMVRDRGLDDYVAVRGRLEGAQLVAAVAGSTLINPTVLSEGFQTSLIETLAAGGRVVTYPVPGADVLRSQGAPIAIAHVRTPAALVAALEQLDAEHPTPLGSAALGAWDWTTRAREFVDVLAAAGAAPPQPHDGHRHL